MNEKETDEPLNDIDWSHEKVLLVFVKHLQVPLVFLLQREDKHAHQNGLELLIEMISGGFSI